MTRRLVAVALGGAALFGCHATPSANARLGDVFLSGLVAVDRAVSDNPVQPIPASLCNPPDPSPAATCPSNR